MTTATVFVDDAVQGHLPMVCVRTGEPADGLHRIHKVIGGSSGWLWLLIFLGPFGWVLLIAALAFSGRSRQLLVRLPYSNGALDQERREFRAAVVAGVVMMASVIAMIVALLGPQPRSQSAETVVYLLIITSVVAALTTFVLASQYSTHRPGIVLDASRRWVNLNGVHANFAARSPIVRHASPPTARNRNDVRARWLPILIGSALAVAGCSSSGDTANGTHVVDDPVGRHVRTAD